MKDNNHFLTGLLLGGLAAGITALLMAPKSGKELYNDIADTYTTLAEKTGTISDDIKHKSWHILHPNDACEICEGSSSHFMTGATIGAVLGVASALLLAPKPGAKLRNDLENTYHNVVDQGEEWKDAAGSFIEKLQTAFNKTGKNASPVQHILDLASVGFQAWQTIQKRK